MTDESTSTRSDRGDPDASDQRDGGSTSRPVVVCEDVAKQFERGSGGLFGRWRRADAPPITALQGVSLAVHEGELLGISGPSGSGKSTLLHLLAALDAPSSGSVVLDGEETTGLSERERSRLRLSTVGIVFQRFHLLPTLSARANVALPLIEEGVPKSQRRERATTLLDRVGLADRITHTPPELSGGEQQRVAIARALVTDPTLVVADEPTGELDSDSGQRVLDVLEDLVADGRAVVLASHDDATLERTDRRITLRDGLIRDA